jgi:hypothetical protein
MRALRAAALTLALCIAWAARAQPVNNQQPAVAVSVGTSPTAIATIVPGRATLRVFNNDAAKTLYLSFSSTVTTATGYPVLPLQWIEYTAVTTAQNLYGVTSTGVLDARVTTALSVPTTPEVPTR